MPAEAARAVLSQRGDDPALAVATAHELADELAAGAASKLPVVLTALSRPTRLIRGSEDDAAPHVDTSKFDCDAERSLWSALAAARAELAPGMRVSEWLRVAAGLAPAVDVFFDSVFVMSEDNAVRRNRLAVVRELAALPAGVVDLAELPGF